MKMMSCESGDRIFPSKISFMTGETARVFVVKTTPSASRAGRDVSSICRESGDHLIDAHGKSTSPREVADDTQSQLPHQPHDISNSLRSSLP
jgi:hypothetical protein